MKPSGGEEEIKLDLQISILIRCCHPKQLISMLSCTCMVLKIVMIFSIVIFAKMMAHQLTHNKTKKTRIIANFFLLFCSDLAMLIFPTLLADIQRPNLKRHSVHEVRTFSYLTFFPFYYFTLISAQVSWMTVI